MSRELKESITTTNQPRANLNKKTETLKTGPKKIVELKYNT